MDIIKDSWSVDCGFRGHCRICLLGLVFVHNFYNHRADHPRNILDDTEPVGTNAFLQGPSRLRMPEYHLRRIWNPLCFYEYYLAIS